jgi:hypothetical protein
MKKIVYILIVLPILMVFNGQSVAMMHGEPINGDHMMANNSGFSMINGMKGSPVVGDDGTAYLISFTPSDNPGMMPTNNSFQSTITAFKTTGETSSLTLKGIVSRPVVEGNVLAVTTSLPDFSEYNIIGNHGVNPGAGQSVLYAVSLPLIESKVPLAVALDGSFASVPVIANDRVYVITTDFGHAMMENGTFDMFGNGQHDFNDDDMAKTYLNIINFDGTLESRFEVQ